MPKLTRPTLLAALTAAGLVLLIVGAWFTVHLGVAGTASFRASSRGGVVVLEPSILNRVDGPVTVTAVGAHGQQLFAGVAAPADADAIVGGAVRTSVEGVRLQDWSLRTTKAGAGSASVMASADIWRDVSAGPGTVRLTVHQSAAPESVVITSQDGRAPELSSLTVTMHRTAWSVESLLVGFVGLLALLGGAFCLWRDRASTSVKES